MDFREERQSLAELVATKVRPAPDGDTEEAQMIAHRLGKLASEQGRQGFPANDNRQDRDWKVALLVLAHLAAQAGQEPVG
jgi:hypothetical protein